MVLVKIRKHDGTGEILKIAHYKRIENAIADVVGKDHTLFQGCVMDSFFKGPELFTANAFSTKDIDGDSVADDFEFHFMESDIFVYIGSVLFSD